MRLMLLHMHRLDENNDTSEVILVNPSHVTYACGRGEKPGVAIGISDLDTPTIIHGSLLQFYHEWTNAMNETGYARDDQEMYLEHTS